MGSPDLWCETFDLDLPKVIHGAREALGDTADQVLFTHAAVTNGRINLPAAWNENEGLASYFGFKGPAAPARHYTERPIVECTFWEALRDLWIHQHLLMVEGVLVWNPTFNSSVGQAFEVLMYKLRSWRPVPEEDVQKNQTIVLESLKEAARLMQNLRGPR